MTRGAVAIALVLLAALFPGRAPAPGFMLVAPAATPRAIVDRLHAELCEALAAPDALEAFVREQIAYWRDTLTRIGLAGME